MKEFKYLNKRRPKGIEKSFKKSFSKYNRTKNKKDLVDIIFYAACILSSRNSNPEALLKKRVEKESSKILYDTYQGRKKN